MSQPAAHHAASARVLSARVYVTGASSGKSSRSSRPMVVASRQAGTLTAGRFVWAFRCPKRAKDTTSTTVRPWAIATTQK